MAEPSRHVVCPHCAAISRVPPDRPAAVAKCGNCHQRLFEGKPVPVDESRFERHRTHDGVPLLVDFWAPWCGPCHAMAPAFEHAAAELEPDFRLLKVNIDQAQALAERYQIRSIPLLGLFVWGELVAQQAGAMTTPAIVGWARAQAGQVPAAAASGSAA